LAATLDDEEWRRSCEARYWISKIKYKQKHLGRESAKNWWLAQKELIGKIRGPDALRLLISDMEKHRDL
jgi:hypothetical protein